MTDPFSELGLSPDAGPDDVRRARRELAKTVHPDAGGDGAHMQHINAAAAAALRSIAARPGDARPGGDRRTDPEPDGRRADAPSFAIEALPVEAFEGLLLAAQVISEVVDDEPPYELTVVMGEPWACWCRLHVVPDAGASTVGISIAALADRRGEHPDDAGRAAIPSLDAVRNAWIDALNALDWTEI